MGTKATDTYSSPRTVTYASSFASSNAIKTSIATAITPQSYSGGALNGATPTPRLPQRPTVTTSAHAASYVAGSKVTWTGTSQAGAPITDTVPLTLVNGGETLSPTKSFATVTQIDVDAQADALGAFTFGWGDLALDSPARELRHGADGTIILKDQAGNLDSLVGFNGEHHAAMVFGIVAAGTTFPLTVYT